MFLAYVLWALSALFLFTFIQYSRAFPRSDNFIYLAGCLLLFCFGFIRYQKTVKKREAAEKAAREKEEKEKAYREDLDRRIAAAKAARMKYLEDHDLIFTRIAGVTFDNDDRTSRQKNLKAIYNDPDKDLGTVSLRKYEYEGDPAYHVLFEGRCIGNIPADYVERIEAVEDRIDRIDLEVEPFENEDGATIYRAELTIGYLK